MQPEKKQAVNIIFDGPPGPECGRFVEVEKDNGHAVNIGKWIERDDGLWALRITQLPAAEEASGESADEPPLHVKLFALAIVIALLSLAFLSAGCTTTDRVGEAWHDASQRIGAGVGITFAQGRGYGPFFLEWKKEPEPPVVPSPVLVVPDDSGK